MIAALCALINRLESSACACEEGFATGGPEMDVYDYGILISNQ